MRGKALRGFLLGGLILGLMGCQVSPDLAPSGSDQRPTVTSGTVGYLPGATSADFTAFDTLGAIFRLSDQRATGATPADATVLYFTMWCPICSAHADNLLFTLAPQFAGRGVLRIKLVDYVSGSVAGAAASEMANGYSPGFALADVGQTIMKQYHASMGSTIVIDAQGVVRMNEDYRDGSHLAALLDAILPP
ncbi:MAG: hypothetical protein COX57_11055 [Alphaproteobacteria bacterium CG_4_10_14_0_2_um_filter_63_37]|nr:MAG: hypothetical protein AUJ55_10560 [Proteobacteria bacterium CG1_02_64_396]PJA23945.1 MAG: hypothetical protein COX57_11055 [Alphaproteobacteria bacterium CG_4_10_14_0_2_um_filter_63_37]